MDRISMIWYGALIFSLILLASSFSFTVINHDYYKAVADRQQTSIEKNPVSRGTIYSSESSMHGVAAISTNLGTLAIDPTRSGSTAKLLDFLSEAVYTEFCSQVSFAECVQSISSYTKSDLTTEPGLTTAVLKEKTKNYLQDRISAPVDSVLVAENLDDTTVEKINQLDDSALFFVVNNLYVNPTKVQSADALA
jgi:cell division protein FtsI/penicillin-binding protein 2